MKTLGLIGGMSWESSLEYYRLLNRQIAARLGGLHSARCILYSVDFAEVEADQRRGDWDQLAQKMVDAAQRLEWAGAEGLLICSNTMHRVADEVSSAVPLPLIHIADATGEAVRRQKLHRVALLGTRYTMEQDFLSRRLRERYGIETILPNPEDRECVHRIIFEELCRGKIEPASREALVGIIGRLAVAGAEGAILGCTELPLLIRPHDVTIPVFDTTALHVEAAVAFVLGK